MDLLTALDVVVLLAVGSGAIFGALRGFTYEAVSLLSWVLAVIALRFLHAPVTDLLAGTVGTPAGAAVLAFGLIFLLVFFGSRLIGRRFGIGVRDSVIGPIDRVLGVGFGAIKGLIGVTLLFLLANLLLDIGYGGGAARPAWMTESRTYPLLNASGRAIIDFVEARQAAGEEEAAEAENAAE